MNQKVNSAPIEAEVRSIIRHSRKAFLGTLDAESGNPFVSLVTVATEMSCRPLLLLSELARHTTNAGNDNRTSLLFDATAEDGDPLEDGRVTLNGRLARVDSETVKDRFLARHRGAAGYAGFADFAFYRLEVEDAFYVGGFGRIQSIPATEFLIEPQQVDQFEQAEPGIIEHMNDDHSDAIALYATKLLGEPDGSWQLCGCDPHGIDLVLDDAVRRLEFPTPLVSPADSRHALADLAKTARSL